MLRKIPDLTSPHNSFFAYSSSSQLNNDSLKTINLNYKLQLNLIIDFTNIYINKQIDTKNFSNIQQNLLVLDDTNNIYFIKITKIKKSFYGTTLLRKCTDQFIYQPQSINTTKDKADIFDKNKILFLSKIDIDNEIVHINKGSELQEEPTEDFINKLFFLSLTSGIEKNSQIYFYLATNCGNGFKKFIATKSSSWHCDSITSLIFDLKIIINRTIVDLDALKLTEQNLIDIQAESNNKFFIKSFNKWVLGEKFVKTKIFGFIDNINTL